MRILATILIFVALGFLIIMSYSTLTDSKLGTTAWSAVVVLFVSVLINKIVLAYYLSRGGGRKRLDEKKKIKALEKTITATTAIFVIAANVLFILAFSLEFAGEEWWWLFLILAVCSLNLIAWLCVNSYEWIGMYFERKRLEEKKKIESLEKQGSDE